MSAEAMVNFPDILGYITDVERHNIGVAQMAMAIKPRVPRAGRPFEVIMLIQNTSDSAIEITVVITTPDRDADKKKDRFIVNTPRLVVEVGSAEVGYVSLPVSTLPDTAVSDNYKVSMEINVQTMEKKPNQIRLPEGGGAFDIKTLSLEKRDEIEKLRHLPFSTTKRGGLFRGNDLEITFGLLAGRVGKLNTPKPGWTHLWSMEDQRDDNVFLQKYAEQLRTQVLPKLRRKALYPPLLEKTKQRFSQVEYELTNEEADFIARVLTLILEYANPSATQQGVLSPHQYNLEEVVSETYNHSKETPLPYWVSAFLGVIARDERVARVPAKAIPHFVYDELFHDAILYSFEVLTHMTGEDLGTLEEMEEYAQDVLARMKRKGEIDFTHVYLPLMLGGVLTFDQMLLADEQLSDILQEIDTIGKARNSERSSQNDAIFGMVQNVIGLTLKKYGYIINR